MASLYRGTPGGQKKTYSGDGTYSELVRAMLPSTAALGLMVLRCVARSTATIPNLGSKPDIHSHGDY